MTREEAQKLFDKMPMINSHASLGKRYDQTVKQQTFLHKHGYKSAWDLFADTVK